MASINTMQQAQLTAKQLLGKAMHFLKFRARSKAEIAKFLQRAMGDSYDELISQEVITTLEQLDLINDYSFSHQMAQSLLRSGKGPKIIEQKLREKNISREIIHETISQLDPELIRNAAVTCLSKKIKSMRETNSFKRRQLLAKYLYSKGFDSSCFRELIDADGDLTVQ